MDKTPIDLRREVKGRRGGKKQTSEEGEGERGGEDDI